MVRMYKFPPGISGKRFITSQKFCRRVNLVCPYSFSIHLVIYIDCLVFMGFSFFNAHNFGYTFVHQFSYQAKNNFVVYMYTLNVFVTLLCPLIAVSCFSYINSCRSFSGQRVRVLQIVIKSGNSLKYLSSYFDTNFQGTSSNLSVLATLNEFKFQNYI